MEKMTFEQAVCSVRDDVKTGKLVTGYDMYHDHFIEDGLPVYRPVCAIGHIGARMNPDDVKHGVSEALKCLISLSNKKLEGEHTVEQEEESAYWEHITEANDADVEEEVRREGLVKALTEVCDAAGIEGCADAGGDSQPAGE